MLSTPPATKSWPSPARTAWAARITALRLAPQTLLTVIAPTLVGSPPSMAHCRAMFWPRPADTTLPMMTSSMADRSGSCARCTAARITVAPRALAGIRLRAPRSRPTGVRAALKMTAVVDSLVLIATALSLHVYRSRHQGLGCEAHVAQVGRALKTERYRRL